MNHLAQPLRAGQPSRRRRRTNALRSRSARGPLSANRHEFSYSFKRVSTITAIVEAHADGSIHLPLPVEMRRGKVKVTATLIPGSGETDQAVNTLDPLRRIAARGGIKSIPDPARWQRKIRQDRPLPGREE